MLTLPGSAESMPRRREQASSVRWRPPFMAKLLKSLLPLLCVAGVLWARPVAAATDYAAIVVDAESGTVLESVAATARWYPASLTKVMTVYLAFEEIEAGRLKLDEELTVSAHAASQPATELGLG